MPDLAWLFSEQALASLLIIGGQLLLLIVVTLIALRLSRAAVRAALHRLFEREVKEGTAQHLTAIELQRRSDTLHGLISNALRVIILIIAFVMALSIVNLDITPAIAGLGIAGLAFSLGAQHLVRDYVAGAFVLIENQYSKGDIVSIAGVTGTVEDVSLRRTTLRDLDGTVHHVPHGLIQVSGNLTRSWGRVNLDVPVLYGQDLGRVREVIDAAGSQLAEQPQWQGKVLEPPHLAHIENLGDQGLVVKVLGVVSALDRPALAGEMRRLIIEAFEREGLVLGWRPPPAPPAPAEQDEQGRNS